MQKNRAINLTNFTQKKFHTIPLSAQWEAHMGKPEATGVWLVYGSSFNGKTGYCLSLAKELANYYKVVYNTLEEGARLSMQTAVIRTGIKEVSRRFTLLDAEPFEDLKVRMRKRKSPHVWFIDSFQYVGLTKKQYLEFKEEFGKKKLIIFLSHAEGNEPSGKVAKFVKYDVDIKTQVRGYKALAASRYGGNEPYIISEERAKKFWGETK